jgi:hypothetical protein
MEILLELQLTAPVSERSIASGSDWRVFVVTHRLMGRVMSSSATTPIQGQTRDIDKSEYGA